MRTIFTCALRGMGWPLSLRAVQVMPPTYTAPVGTALSMLSVTRIEDLLNLRISPAGFPFADGLPGHLQLRCELLLSQSRPAAHLL